MTAALLDMMATLVPGAGLDAVPGQFVRFFVGERVAQILGLPEHGESPFVRALHALGHAGDVAGDRSPTPSGVGRQLALTGICDPRGRDPAGHPIQSSWPVQTLVNYQSSRGRSRSPRTSFRDPGPGGAGPRGPSTHAAHSACTETGWKPGNRDRPPPLAAAPQVRFARLGLLTGPVLALRKGLLTLTCAVMLSACVRQMEDVRGVESYIRKIELEGVNRFKEKELVAYLNIGESSRLFWRPKYVFSEAMLPIDAERILEIYRAYGYYDAEVVSMVPDTKVGRIRLFGKHKGERIPGKTQIKIVVREGAPTKVTDLAVHWPDGPPVGPPDEHATEDAIAETSLLKEGEAFEIPKLNTSAQLLRGHMQDRGYAFAQVKDKAVIDPGRGVEVDFELRPGPFVKIGKITIEGLVGVPEKYIRNEIDFAPGKRYSPTLLTRIEQKIYGMDVFTSVSIDADDKPRGDGTIDLTIRVIESKTQSIKVGPGIGIDPVRWEQRGTFLYSHKNLGHNLTRFDMRVTAGYAELPSLFNPQAHGPLLRIDPKFQQKGFLEKRTTWTLAPSFELGIWQGYQFYSPQLRMGPSRFFGKYTEVSLTYNLRFVDFFNVSEALRLDDNILGLDFRDPYFVSYLEPQVNFYFVDSILKPRNGAILGVTYDIAGLGGDYSFHKIQPTIRGYYAPHRRIMLAARASVGFMFPFGAKAGTPIDMRFYLGGSDTVRGWGLRRLSPKVFLADCQSDNTGACEDGVPTGGQTMVLANFETRVLLVDKLSMVGFFDMGDVRGGVRSFSPKNWNYSVGPGVRFESPIGVFRLDVGFRLNETDQSAAENRIWAVHFGLGEAF